MAALVIWVIGAAALAVVLFSAKLLLSEIGKFASWTCKKFKREISLIPQHRYYIMH